MKTVNVAASVPYAVRVGEGLISRADGFIPEGARIAAVVSDDRVFPLYGKTLTDALARAGLRTPSFVFPNGERSKVGGTYLDILGFLAGEGLTRSDIVVALGGGVVGDVAGFAAATYMRGIRYVQVPTTLLAAVDSSVGGKCAIDLPQGKNLAGAFYQPAAVVCDVTTLSTLPSGVFADGCAEALKYGVIGDEKLFCHLSERGALFDREYVISRCVEMKADIVSRDEFDLGERALLNLGHTFGHAVEAESGYSVTHGKAVAIGMATVARGAVRLGLSEPGTDRTIVSALEKLGLPTRADPGKIDAAIAAMKNDKKRRGDETTVVIPKRIGECVLTKMTREELEELMKGGAE